MGLTFAVWDDEIGKRRHYKVTLSSINPSKNIIPINIDNSN
jgi:hypothetical protein